MPSIQVSARAGAPHGLPFRWDADTLARGLNFDVVAKGVETQAQRDFLVEAGCRVCQGELFAPAGTADQLEPLLRARQAA